MIVNYAFSYIEANFFCILIFLILLFRSLRGIDRQLKQSVFNKVMISHVLYFISDIVWVMVLSNIIPKTRLTVTIPNLCNSIILFSLTYYWFYYVEISQGMTYLLDKRNIFLTQLPGSIPIFIMIILFIFFPEKLITPELTMTRTFTSLFIFAPITYVIVAAVKSITRAFKKENYVYRGQYLIYGLYPLLLVVFGVFQAFFTIAPIFCFSSTVLMVYVYVASVDDLISLDPLTGLNNRAQLKRYIAQEASHNNHDHNYYIIMLDLNKFKDINDTYGHAEGDKAIVMAAEAIKKACSNQELRPFISRYGGDEFLIIVKTNNPEDVDLLEAKIRQSFEIENIQNHKQYKLSTSIGHSHYDGSIDQFMDALNRADQALYEDKHSYHNENTD